MKAQKWGIAKSSIHKARPGEGCEEALSAEDVMMIRLESFSARGRELFPQLVGAVCAIKV